MFITEHIVSLQDNSVFGDKLHFEHGLLRKTSRSQQNSDTLADQSAHLPLQLGRFLDCIPFDKFWEWEEVEYRNSKWNVTFFGE